MKYFVLDASALGKRYVPEDGTPLVHHLFGHVTTERLFCLSIGALEVLSVIVRARNGNRITPDDALEAVTALEDEVFFGTVRTFSAPDDVVFAAASLVQRHSINSTDAILLRTALNLRPELQAAGDDLVLVTADRRLARAGKAEGLTTFDPETEDMAFLDALIATP